MIAISVKLTIAPNDIDSFIAAVSKVIAPTRAENGCLRYAFARDLLEPNVLWVSEEWESLEHLHAHLVTPHIVQLLEEISSLDLISQEDNMYEVSSVGPVQFPDA